MTNLAALFSSAEGETPSLSVEQRFVEDLYGDQLLLAGLVVDPPAKLHLYACR